MRFVQLMSGEYGLCHVNLDNVAEIQWDETSTEKRLTIVYNCGYAGNEVVTISRGNEAEENYKRILDAIERS